MFFLVTSPCLLVKNPHVFPHATVSLSIKSPRRRPFEAHQTPNFWLVSSHEFPLKHITWRIIQRIVSG